MFEFYQHEISIGKGDILGPEYFTTWTCGLNDTNYL